MNSSHRQPSYALVLSALIAVQVLFGLNYVISKIVVEAFPPLVWASIRIVVAAVLMLIVALVLRRPHPKLERSFFVPLVGLSLLGTIINQGCFLVGLHYTTPTNSAILNTLIPIFTLMIVTLRGQEALTPVRALGFFSAFCGVLVLRKVEDFTLSDGTAFGDLLTMINCLSFALFLSYSKKFFERYDRFWTTAWLFIYGSVGLTVVATPDWMEFSPPEMTPGLWAAAIFAVVGGTLLTYFLNNWALAHTQSSHVALFVYIQPVVATTLAWAWLGTEVTLRTIGSSFLIFVGVLLSLSRRRKR